MSKCAADPVGGEVLGRAGCVFEFAGLVATSRLVADRPAGSVHPQVPEFARPIGYGYRQDTVAAEGGGADLFHGRAGSAGVVSFFVTAERRVGRPYGADRAGEGCGPDTTVITSSLSWLHVLGGRGPP